MNYWLRQTERDRTLELAGLRPIEKQGKYAHYFMLSDVSSRPYNRESIEEMENNALKYLAKGHCAGFPILDVNYGGKVTDCGWKSAEVERHEATIPVNRKPAWYGGGWGDK